LSKEKFSDKQLNFTVKNKKVFYNITIQQTVYIAEILAEVIRPGDTVLLFGEIGSGKTFFSRAMIQKMMEKQGAVVEDIPSPTFTIVQIYDTLVPSVWHLDLYRISNPDEIIDLDLENALEKHVCLIEWPQHMGLHVPERNISITLEEILGSGDVRNIDFEFYGTGWEHIIRGLIKWPLT
jgi:tRNA threonylcarbamoyladenosine biosynthesis protein TsaE|tara:strand:- start:8 stop:547 length:540 start_codon:yes stop_codon:yes gene_type:complete